ncbi:MAG: Bax inhibitor-1/YccA family protein [Rhizobiaceae bacterium]|nr:Bax inhibitor-1/YccA family protein [Rhizobiaceae bacterium]
MADYREPQARFGNTAAQSTAEYDQGLRSYMLGIYNYMALALAFTGVAALATAWFAASNPAFANAIYASPLRYVIMFSPLAFVLVLSFGINKLSLATTQLVFWAFAGIMGMSMSWIFMVYTSASVVQVFFITAAAFGSLSLYGYTTQRNLTGMGSFLMMGLFGLIIAMLVNLYMQSSAMQFAISVIGVLIFAGLTAYDTQRLKLQYDHVAGNTVAMGKATIMGALSLYLNFINMFMMLLNLFGNRN